MVAGICPLQQGTAGVPVHWSACQGEREDACMVNVVRWCTIPCLRQGTCKRDVSAQSFAAKVRPRSTILCRQQGLTAEQRLRRPDALSGGCAAATRAALLAQDRALVYRARDCGLAVASPRSSTGSTVREHNHPVRYPTSPGRASASRSSVTGHGRVLGWSDEG